VSQADWSSVAGAWDRHFDWNHSCFRPFLEWFRSSIDAVPGARVLDLAGGTGFPAIPLARMHPGVSFVLTDISASMVEFASRRAASERLMNIECRVLDAHALDYADESFDAVTSAFGLMLCEDPVQVASEIRRVLKPGGRFAVVVWDTPTKNPFLAIFGRAIVASGIVDRPERTEPGPFRLAEPGELVRVLREGGFTDVAIESREATVTYDSIDDYIEKGSTLPPNVAEKVAGMPAVKLQALERLVCAEAAPLLTSKGLMLKATALCASGQRIS
jgi:SAM-dependent methyltransferase